MTAPGGTDWLSPPPDAGLARSAARSGALTLTAQTIAGLVGIASTIVLARLLTPEAFGLIAMVASFQFLVGALRDLGIGQAIVQRETLTESQVHGVFRWSVVIGVVNLIVFSAVAPLLAVFYDEPRVMAIAICFGGFGAVTAIASVPRAILTRSMRFRAIASIEVASQLIASGSAITAAALGAGYWSLIVQPGVAAVIVVALSFACAGYTPRSAGSMREAAPLLAFGVKTTGSTFMHGVVRNTDNILIGRVSGDVALGQYAMAYRLLTLPIVQINNPLVQVAVPTLSRLQSDPGRYRMFYRHAVLLATTVGMPLVCGLVFVCADLLPLVLGDGWGRSIDLFRLLAIPAFLGTFNFATGVAYITCDAVGKQLRWSVWSGILTVGAFLLGIRWGPEGVAVGYALVSLVLRPIGIAYCCKWTLPTPADVISSIWRPATASLATLSFGTLILASMNEADPSLQRTIVALAAFAIGYAVIWVALPGGRAASSSIVETVRLLRGGSRDSSIRENQTGETP